MKKVILLLMMAALMPAVLRAQVTDAPDQGEPATLETSDPVVTEEREIVAANGVVYNDGQKDYVSSGVKFEINATDSGSGVKSIWVAVDDAAFGVYTQPLGASVEGSHTIAYKVEDNVGNVSPVKNYEFVVDATAPHSVIRILDKSIRMGDTQYISATNRVEIRATDNLSGVSKIEYSIDNGDWKEYKGTLVPELGSGLHTVSYRAADNVGNVSVISSTSLFVDNTAPEVRIEGSSLYNAGEKTYGGKDSRFIIEAADQETGVARVLYSIDNGAAMEYLEPVRLEAGVHVLKAWAMDELGNTSAEISLTVEIDGETPSANLVPVR